MTAHANPSMRPAYLDHELKCWPGPFSELAAGIKTAEFRRDDRDFRPGDRLLLREWSPRTETYTGRKLVAMVTSKTTEFGIPEGFAMLSLRLEPSAGGTGPASA